MVRRITIALLAAIPGFILAGAAPAAHAATAITVTATETVSGGELNGLNVAVLDGAAATQNGAAVTATGTALSPAQASITPHATGSYVYGSVVSWNNHGTAYTADTATTFKGSLVFTNSDAAVYRSKTATTASAPVTLGASAPAGATNGSLAMSEILAASGQTLTEDASTPLAKTGTGTALTTASFTPPAGSLLVASSTGSGPSGPYNITISNTGTALTWTRLAYANPVNQDVSGVWVAAIPPAPPAGNTKLYLLDLNSTNYSWTTVAPRYGAIELNDWNTDFKTSIRAASPATKVYVYKDLTSTRELDCGTGGGGQPCVVNGVICPAGTNDAPFYAGGLGFCTAWRAHPEWFLTNDGTTATSSTPISNLHAETGFTSQYEMDYGNAAYQSAWLSTVKADLQANGWDGIRADNALVTATAYGSVPKYPTDASVQTATQAMLQVVGPGLTGAGLTIIPNVGFDNLYPTLWASWLQYVSGLMQEFSWYWDGGGTQGSQNGTDGSYWGPWMEPEVQACASQVKSCLFMIAAGDSTLTAAQQTFALGSYLLYADGTSYIGENPAQDTALARSLGAATDSAADVSGTYTRHFANGSVVVNSTNGTATITGG